MTFKKQQVGFLVATEYHILACLSAIDQFYSSVDEYEITIYFTVSENNTRLKYIEHSIRWQHVKTIFFKYDEAAFNFDNKLITIINQIKEKGFNTFVVFNHHTYLGTYLYKVLKRQGTYTCLAPDGAKPYCKVKPFAPRWSFQVGLKYYKFLKLHRLGVRYFQIPNTAYANLNEIEELWVQFPKTFPNTYKKRVKQLNILENESVIEEAKFLFDFSKYEMDKYEKVIFFCNQPIYSTERTEFELQLLKDICNKFPDHSLVIKLHPITNSEHIKSLAAIPNAVILDYAIPAELYIRQLKNSIMISYWSSAAFVPNADCRFYWLYPWLEKEGMMLQTISIKSPSPHIKEVSSLSEIV